MFNCEDCGINLVGAEDAYVSVTNNKIYCEDCKRNHSNIMSYESYIKLDDGDIAEFNRIMNEIDREVCIEMCRGI